MRFNLESLKQEFIEYMTRIGKQDSINIDEVMRTPTSVFTASSDFKNFLTNEKHINPTEISTDISKILKQNIKDGQLQTTRRNREKELGFVSGLINELLNKDKVKEFVDKDNDGNLSEKEITNFLNAMSQMDENNPNISIQDLFNASEAIEDGTMQLGEAAPVNTDTGADSSGESHNPSNNHTPNNSSNVNENTNNNDNTTKSIENMSEDELKTQLQSSESELNENKTKLDGLMSGSDSTLQAMQTDIDNAYTAYNDELKKVDVELAKKLEESEKAVTEQEKLINDKDREIASQETTVSKAKMSYENAQATTSSLKSRKAELENEKANGDQDGKITQLISQINSAISSAEAEEANKKKEMEDAQSKLDTLKKENEELKNGENGLTKKKEKVAETERIILEAHPELQDLQNNYENAKKAYDDFKTSEIAKAQEAVNASQAEVDKINNEISNRSRNSLLSQFNTSELKGKYNLNGKEYNTVMDQNALDKLVKDAARGGAGTKYGHADTCLSIAETYGLWATGDSKRGFSDSGVWGYGDASAYKQFANDDKATVMAKIKEELDAGRPVVLHVNGKSDHSRHYVTVVGYSSSAGSTLNESDLLLWDSYASTIRDCGNPNGRHMITGYDTGRTGNKGYGYQLYVRKT